MNLVSHVKIINIVLHCKQKMDENSDVQSLTGEDIEFTDW